MYISTWFCIYFMTLPIWMSKWPNNYHTDAKSTVFLPKDFCWKTSRSQFHLDKRPFLCQLIVWIHLKRTSLLRRIYVLYFQLWRLVFLEPPGLQRHIVAHFKGLINANRNLKSSRVWHHFYLLPHPFENGHFTL